MSENYYIHQWKFLNSEIHITRDYGSVEAYIQLFSNKNSPYVYSLKSSVDNNTLTLIVDFNGRECYKQVLTHGHCDIWMHDTQLVKLTAENLSNSIIYQVFSHGK